MRASHSLRVVKTGLIVTARFEIGDPAVRVGDNSCFVPNTIACVGHDLTQAGSCANSDPGPNKAYI